jgi:hypothetical protein
VCIVVPGGSLGFYMKKTSDIRDQLLDLRKLEDQAVVDFTKAKNFLIKIRKQRRELEKLLTPSEN